MAYLLLVFFPFLALDLFPFEWGLVTNESSKSNIASGGLKEGVAEILIMQCKSITYSTFKHDEWQEKLQSNLQDTFPKQHTILWCLESLQCFFLSIQGFPEMQMHSQPRMWKISVIVHYQSNGCHKDTRLQIML